MERLQLDVRTISVVKEYASGAATTDVPAAVRGTALTGLSTANATPITATDSVLSAAGKLQAQIGAKLNTTDVPSAVRGTALTGLSTATATPITAADTVLVATGKLQAQINAGGGAAGGGGATDVQLRDRATHTGTQLAATVSDFTPSVRSTALTGLSTATATPITATDSVLSAAGKLQRQATDNAALLPPPFDTSWYKTGLYYDAAYPYYTTISPLPTSPAAVLLCKRKILDAVTFNELSVNVTTAAAGSVVFYGIYASGANGLPSTLLASGSAVSTTTGVKSTAVTLALTKGQVVWDAYLCTGASVSVTGFRLIFQGGAPSPIVNGSTMLIISGQASLPADVSAAAFISATASTLPRVALRAA